MFKRISKFFIDNLLLRVDIVDIINSRIKLIKQGKNYVILCPFHNEKTPSFIVNSYKQFFYCFGCGIYGNVIEFLVKYENLTFVESINEISSFYGISVIYENSEYLKFNKYDNLYLLMNEIKDYYKKLLISDIGVLAKSYLFKRGLDDKIINYFEIGFAPLGWDNIIKKFKKKKGVLLLLEKLGIIVNNNGKLYDRFRGCIIFPIKNKLGNVIAFGGRIIIKSNIKYLNSPETKIFNKGFNLYGLYEVNKQKSKISKLLIVEGYIDVVTLFQFNINYVVSSLGTSTTINHVKLLYLYTDCIFCCYDGDNAGRNAAWKFLLKSLPYLTDGKQLFFIFLPEGEDPDSFIRKFGKKIFEKYIKKALPLSTFLFNKLISEVDLSVIYGRVKFISLILPLINQIPNKILQFYLRQQLCLKVGILDINQLDIIISKKKINTLPLLNIKRTLIHLLIGLLVQNPKLSTIVPFFEITNKDIMPGLLLFLDLVKMCNTYFISNTNQLLEYYCKNKYFSQLKILSTWDHLISNKLVKETFIELLLTLCNSLLELRQNALIAHDRMYNLSFEEKKELLLLNKILSRN